MIALKSLEEIELIGRGGSIIGALFREMEARVAPGVSTGQLDAFAEEFIRGHEGAVPAFKGLYGFPGAVCASLNEEIVHGIPSPKRVLEEGDILTIDVGVRLEGWCSDSAKTFAVGEIGEERSRLLEVTERALEQAIEAVRPGSHVGDIGHAVEEVVRGTGFRIVRDLVGHGIGREVHEEPQVPNYGKRGKGPELKPGMVLAIEPMIAVGSHRIRTLADRWTMVTVDGSAAAHFEHTVAVTETGSKVLTLPIGALGTDGAAPSTSALKG